MENKHSEDVQYIQSLLDRIDTVDPHVTCCKPCHLTYEEDYAFPFLPPGLQKKLKKEHDDFRKNGYEKEKFLEHSKREEAAFRYFCPPEIMERIEADHLNAHLELGEPYFVRGMKISPPKGN